MAASRRDVRTVLTNGLLGADLSMSDIPLQCPFVAMHRPDTLPDHSGLLMIDLNHVPNGSRSFGATQIKLQTAVWTGGRDLWGLLKNPLRVALNV